MIKPMITVAVPTCNGARHLRTTLESIARSPTPHDLVISDDRSDDETLAIVRAVVGDRARVEVNSERLGLAGNWNRCVARSETPVVAIFHQDDVMLAEHLATHLEAYRQEPTLGWVASGSEVIDAVGKSVAVTVVDPGGLGSRDRDFAAGLGVDPLAGQNPLRCSAVTISRSAHAEVGGFDPSYRYVVDWDYWVRIAHLRPVAWRARTTAAIRWHPASETHRFATGTDDLDETACLLDRVQRLVDPVFDTNSGWRSSANRRLARAFLNRAHVAFKSSDLPLARRALLRSLRLAPGSSAKNLLLDPRLLAQMGAAIVAPQWVRRVNQTSVSSEGVLPDRLESGDNA